MKKIYLIIILAISSLSLTAQPSDSINWQAVINDYYTKYQPQKSPAWLFPLIFEEGTGQRDTIYLGFDDEATIGYDSLFGERFTEVDTSIFRAGFLKHPQNPTTFLRSRIIDDDYINTSIEFINGITPFTVYWDVSLFYHDSLGLFISDTFDHNVVPYTYATMGIDYYRTIDNYCNWTYFPVISDFITQGYYCIRQDSIHLVADLFNHVPVPMISIPSFNIQPLYRLFVNTESVKKSVIKVYPNPTSNVIYLEFDELKYHKIIIYDLLGKQVKPTYSFHDDYTQIDISELPKGLYFLSVFDENDDLNSIIKVVKK